MDLENRELFEYMSSAAQLQPRELFSPQSAALIVNAYIRADLTPSSRLLYHVAEAVQEVLFSAILFVSVCVSSFSPRTPLLSHPRHALPSPHPSVCTKTPAHTHACTHMHTRTGGRAAFFAAGRSDLGQFLHTCLDAQRARAGGCGGRAAAAENGGGDTGAVRRSLSKCRSGTQANTLTHSLLRH